MGRVSKSDPLQTAKAVAKGRRKTLAARENKPSVVKRRPKALTEKQQTLICFLLSGASVEKAAALTGCTVKDARKWLHTDATFQRVLYMRQEDVGRRWLENRHRVVSELLLLSLFDPLDYLKRDIAGNLALRSFEEMAQLPAGLKPIKAIKESVTKHGGSFSVTFVDRIAATNALIRLTEGGDEDPLKNATPVYVVTAPREDVELPERT